MVHMTKKKQKQKHNTICVGHHYAQAHTHKGTGKLRNEKKRNETKRKQNPTKSVK